MSRLPLLVLVASLAGCYAQLQDDSVQLDHSLCSNNTACIPGGTAVTPIPASQAFNTSGLNTFTIGFGDNPAFQASQSVGPATLNNTLALNSASFVMATSGADFSGITSVQLLSAPQAASPGVDPCPAANSCPVIAVYDSTVDGPATQSVVMRSQVANLLTLINSSTHDLIIEVKVTGNAPTAPQWNAHLVMDMAVKARANFP